MKTLIKLRLMAAALLFHEGSLLMMKRSPLRTISPGLWAAVGGHLEPQEIADPRTAVLREIHEETGLHPEDIRQLSLRYILIRQNGLEIRQQFIYTGQALKRDVIQTEEGDLHWIPRVDILNRELPFIFRRLLEHYLADPAPDSLWLGMAGTDTAGDGTLLPVVRWQTVTDPGVI